MIRVSLIGNTVCITNVAVTLSAAKANQCEPCVTVTCASSASAVEFPDPGHVTDPVVATRAPGWCAPPTTVSANTPTQMFPLAVATRTATEENVPEPTTRTYTASLALAI